MINCKDIALLKMIYEREDDEFRVSFTLEEIRESVLKELPKAQDQTSEFFLSHANTYEYYHRFIEEFFKRNKTKKPSNADALAYIVLLSYRESIIKEATSFDDFRLFSKKKDDIGNTDFEIVEIIDGQYDEFDEVEIDRYDCICTRKRLQNVYKVENRTTGIRLCIGCECIKKCRLIPEKDLAEKKKKMDEKKKANRERKREMEEGKPLGYYKQQREQAKKQRLEERELRKKEKLDMQLMKEQDQVKSGAYRRCYGCDSSLICIRYSRAIRFCQNCIYIDKVINAVVALYKKTYERNNCSNCEISFVSKKCEDKYLCKKCECHKKMTDCSWCNTLFVDSIHSLDKYCDSCTVFMKKCVDCMNDFKSTQINGLRCDTCQYVYFHSPVIVHCEKCDEEFGRKRMDSWIKICRECHLRKKTENEPISKICDSCDEEFWIHPTEKWKTMCGGCFKRSITKFNCVTCKKEFKKLPNESWKTMCYNCYVDVKNL